MYLASCINSVYYNTYTICTLCYLMFAINNLFPDINECITLQHNCSQLCNNSAGSYQCYCREGFELEEDGRGCRGWCVMCRIK